MNVNQAHKAMPCGAARKAVMAVLMEAKRPLMASEIADLSGVAVEVTRTHLSNLCRGKEAHNLNPFTKRACYVWGPHPEEKPVEVVQRYAPVGTYVPAPTFTRPGSEQFLECPSRRGDELVPHRLPISLAGG